MPEAILPARPHVALYNLSQASDEALLSSWAKVLSITDKQRLKNLTSQRRRRDFIAGRFILRTLLCHIFGERHFMLTSEWWIPKATDNQENEYACSISHSHNWLAVACTEGTKVGVDIEIPKANRDIRAAARLLFAKDNLPSWFYQSESAIERGFYAEWCAREALVKCLGDGNVFDSATIKLSEKYGLMGYQHANLVLPGDTADRMFMDIRWAERETQSEGRPDTSFRGGISPALYIAMSGEHKTISLTPFLINGGT